VILLSLLMLSVIQLSQFEFAHSAFCIAMQMFPMLYGTRHINSCKVKNSKKKDEGTT